MGQFPPVISLFTLFLGLIIMELGHLSMWQDSCLLHDITARWANDGKTFSLRV